MKLSYLPLCLLLSGSLAGAATEENIDRKFTAQPGGSLVVDVQFGSIEVSTNGTDEVSVQVFRKVTRRSKSAEQEYLERNPVEITQEGSTVTVRCKTKSKLNWSWGGRERNEAKYTVLVPARFDTQLTTAGGGIDVRDLQGKTRANTSGGGLKFERLSGPLEGSTSGGGIRLRDCAGELKVNTSGGGIEAVGGSGSLHAVTSGGSITVRDFAGPANVGTSGGGLTLERISGELRGSTSGGSIKAVLATPFKGDVKLSTSGGGVTVAVPDSAAFEIDAATSAGGVSSDLAVTMSGKVEPSRLRGTVNGGGPTLHLRSSAGSIKIVKL